MGQKYDDKIKNQKSHQKYIQQQARGASNNHTMCSTSSCWIWISACAMYCCERVSTRETVEMKMWNKVVIFAFSAQSIIVAS